MARQTTEDEEVDQFGVALYGPSIRPSDTEGDRRSSRRERAVDERPALLARYAGVTDVRSRFITDRNEEKCDA